MDRIIIVFLVIGFSTLTGIGDAAGFYHASRSWSNDRMVMSELMKSISGFSIGILSFIFLVRFLKIIGVNSTELQTMIWFLVTVVGIALLSGEFLHWSKSDQLIGIAIIIGIGWLIIKGP